MLMLLGHGPHFEQQDIGVKKESLEEALTSNCSLIGRENKTRGTETFALPPGVNRDLEHGWCLMLLNEQMMRDDKQKEYPAVN